MGQEFDMPVFDESDDVGYNVDSCPHNSGSEK